MKACSYSTRYKGKKRPKCGGKVLAPCDTCLGKYFPAGTRIKLGGDWKDWGTSRKLPIGTEGTILGLSRTQGCLRLTLDGRKTPQTFHFSFLERIHGTKHNRRVEA